MNLSLNLNQPNDSFLLENRQDFEIGKNASWETSQTTVCYLQAAVWRAKSVITKTYKLTHFTDKLCSCMDKSYRNEKLFSTTGQIVS